MCTAVRVVELERALAGKFQVLALVLAYRDVGGPAHQESVSLADALAMMAGLSVLSYL
jgi:hypothetical protein